MSHRNLFFFAGLLVLSLGFISRPLSTVDAHHYIPTLAECRAQGRRITICHATSSETNPYTEITIACEALYGDNGNAGHFDENGTTHAGHEDDYVPHAGESCLGAATPTPTPTVTPTPTPTATPQGNADPTPTPTPQGDVEPTSTPTPTLRSTPEPTGIGGGNSQPGRRTALGTDGVSCHAGNFDAVMDVFENTTPIKDAVVRFTYNNSAQESRSNDLGRARVSFAYQGSGQVVATTDGYPSQSISVGQLSCPEGSAATNNGSNSGSNQSGSVLGVSSLANTGFFGQVDAVALATTAIGALGTAWQLRRPKTV